ncbi:MAG: hypothetical protein ACUVRL_03285 [Candidatus Saccharicenans sp.]|uniref:hypothetical protein n=1 Tax=Candidatus Saccharicenans sp. TaxID=2819258 RepID=UPI00404961EE
MKKITNGLKIIAVITLSLVLFSCNPVERSTNSASYLIIENIIGKDNQGNDSSVVFSDVSINGIAYPDFVNISLRAATLDPNPVMGVSQYSDVMVTNYIVTYTRNDGATGEGTDVPYHFEGALSTLVPIGSTVTIPLMIVRDVAKTQPPLNALVGDPTGIIECTATIELIGHDLRNREVRKTGQISVRFADYIDQ